MGKKFLTVFGVLTIAANLDNHYDQDNDQDEQEQATYDSTDKCSQVQTRLA